MAIVVKGNQVVGVINLEEYAGADHQQPDPQHAPEQRNEKPVTDVGDELALAPPRRSGIAGPEWVSTENTRASAIRDGHHLDDRLAKHLDDFQGLDWTCPPHLIRSFKDYSRFICASLRSHEAETAGVRCACYISSITAL